MNQDIINSLKNLKTGKIILYPTDTVWGIGCDATDYKAVSQIFFIKKRAESKSLVILVDSVDMLRNYISKIPLKAFEIIENTHKPTTIIYDNPIGLAKNVVALDNTVAIRIVNDEFCQKLIKELGKPIVSTSANVSGKDTPSHFKEISDEIKNAVNYIVKWRQNDNEQKSASAIIKIDNENHITFIRK